MSLTLTDYFGYKIVLYFDVLPSSLLIFYYLVRLSTNQLQLQLMFFDKNSTVDIKSANPDGRTGRIFLR